MKINALKTSLKEIQFLRTLFLQENNFQIRYNACHERGWSDSYILTIDDAKIGYGSIKGKESLADRDTVFEFYIIPSFRKMSALFFAELLTASKAVFIECQSNDFLLSSMLYEFAKNIYSDVILFSNHTVTTHTMPGIIFRNAKEDDKIFDHTGEPKGDYVLEKDNEIIATGGFMLHYNMPFADLYMEVAEPYRRKGFGAFLIQELIKACYLKGRVPAARCNINNKASKATLIKGGLKVCGYMLAGDVKPERKP